MVIFFEINPPKVIENESNSDAQERMHNLVRKFDSILQTCGGVLVTDSVLGKPRFDPVMGAHKTSARKIRIIKKTKQTSSVPAWVIARTRRSVRTNPKRRDWRHAHARLG